MIQLPAGAARTTRRLRICAATTGAIAVALTATTAVLDVVWLVTDRGPGAHKTLLAATGIAIVVAAVTGAVASSRRFSVTATIAVTAELARLQDTQRQVVAELGRLRGLVRDRDDLLAELARERAAAEQRAAAAFVAGRQAGAREAMEVIERVDRAEASGRVKRLRTS